MTINRHLQNPSTGEPFRAHRTGVGRGKLGPLGGELCLAEGPMTITVFDPRTGKPVIVTVPDKPASSDLRDKVGGAVGLVRGKAVTAC